ncbi:MAG: Ldh family oxidoreductase [Azospirillaceae bacterium]
MSRVLGLDDARALAAAVLAAHGTSEVNARATAAALVAAEADGLASHGLSRLPAYADQARAGKVDGHATPVVDRPKPGAVRVDAATGFAFPALDAGLPVLESATRALGVAGMAIANSHHFGVAGHPVERLARAGLVGLAFANSPAAIAPWGGARPLFGTNPVAMACPRGAGADPLVVDMSLSKVARGKVMVAARKGEAIPDDWALDAGGRPTTDPAAALKGSMLPMGDAKGAALVLAVEILATAFTGAAFGFEASSFFDAEGPPPRVGQLVLAIAPDAFGTEGVVDRVETLLAAMGEEPDVRVPGARRFAARRHAEAEGIAIPDDLADELARRAA